MNAVQVKSELHQFIDDADERILNLMYRLMKADQNPEDLSSTHAHEKLLEERLKAHEEGLTDKKLNSEGSV